MEWNEMEFNKNFKNIEKLSPNSTQRNATQPNLWMDP